MQQQSEDGCQHLPKSIYMMQTNVDVWLGEQLRSRRELAHFRVQNSSEKPQKYLN